MKTRWVPEDRGYVTPCWIWQGATRPDGYGVAGFRVEGRSTTTSAHRFVYERLIGPVSKDLFLDHLCRQPGCVNPEHMEPVTPRENQLRGETFAARNAAKTHCPQGHPYDESNTYRLGSRRHCRACGCARQRRYRARKAMAA